MRLITATLEITLHPSPNRRNPQCLSAFGGVKGFLLPFTTLHHPSPFSVFVCGKIVAEKDRWIVAEKGKLQKNNLGVYYP